MSGVCGAGSDDFQCQELRSQIDKYFCQYKSTKLNDCGYSLEIDTKTDINIALRRLINLRDMKEQRRLIAPLFLINSLHLLAPALAASDFLA